MAEKSNLILNTENNVTVVSFADPTILDAYHVQMVAKELYDLVEKQGYTRLIIDLAAIKMLSSQTLGVFLNLRQKLEAVSGKMAISGIDPQLYRVFKVTSLDHIFEFYANRDEAIKTFK